MEKELEEWQGKQRAKALGSPGSSKRTEADGRSSMTEPTGRSGRWQEAVMHDLRTHPARSAQSHGKNHWPSFTHKSRSGGVAPLESLTPWGTNGPVEATRNKAGSRPES